MDKRNSRRLKDKRMVTNETRKVDHRNIVLIGHRCSGKSAVGRELAKALGRPFVDTDEWIEQWAGCAIQTLVLRHGWGRFRAFEEQVIGKVSKGDNLVISTGGGAVLDAANVKHLQAKGFIVWLQADAAVLRSRMTRDPSSGRNRPALSGGDVLDEIADVLRQRTPQYEKTADLVVNTTHLDIDGVTESILRHIVPISAERVG